MTTEEAEALVSKVQDIGKEQQKNLETDAFRADLANQGFQPSGSNETTSGVPNIESTVNEKKEGLFESLTKIGEKKHASWMEGIRGKFSQVKEAANQLLGGIRENYKKLESVYKVGVAIGTTTEGRNLLSQAIAGKAREAQDGFNEKYEDIKADVSDKKEKVVGAFQERYKAMTGWVDDELIKPTVETATEIKDGMVEGVRTGVLVGRTLKEVAVGAGVIVGEAGKQVATEVKEATEAKAREIGGRLSEYFRNTVREVQTGIKKSGVEMVATFYTVQAKGIMSEVEADIEKGITSREATIKAAERIDSARKLQVKAALARQGNFGINQEPVEDGWHKIKLGNYS